MTARVTLEVGLSTVQQVGSLGHVVDEGCSAFAALSRWEDGGDDQHAVRAADMGSSAQRLQYAPVAATLSTEQLQRKLPRKLYLSAGQLLTCYSEKCSTVKEGLQMSGIKRRTS